jgi:hypothetical protein
MPPNNYNIVPNNDQDSIELLVVPGEQQHNLEDQQPITKRISKHARAGSTSSFIHFRGPSTQHQAEQDPHVLTNANKLASQVSSFLAAVKFIEG